MFANRLIKAQRYIKLKQKSALSFFYSFMVKKLFKLLFLVLLLMQFYFFTNTTMNLIIKKSNFFGIMYADEIQEKDFIGYNAMFELIGDKQYLIFYLRNDLDSKIILSNINQFEVITIMDAYFVRKLKQLIQQESIHKKIFLKISDIHIGVVQKIKFSNQSVKLNIY